MKKLLITATDMMTIQFLAPHIHFLSKNGFQVEIACSEVGNRMADVRDALSTTAKAIHTIHLARTPLSLRNILGYRDLKKLLRDNQYDLIWTNEPVMGALTRLAAGKQRKAGTKVIYLCHGFHFYKGSGLLRWLIFYPIERFLSRLSDCIITINHEDHAVANTFHAPRSEYIHGIGMNPRKLRLKGTDLRKELGLSENAFLILSVGELNRNKNHRVILHALAILNDPDIHYLLCGKGGLAEELKLLASSLGLSDRVHFMGYRSDLADFYAQADLFALPSYREGVSVASLEAMYFGLPLVTSRVRGSSDYLQEGISGFLRDAGDARGFAEAIRRLKTDTALRIRCGSRNREAVLPYQIDSVEQELLVILNSL